MRTAWTRWTLASMLLPDSAAAAPSVLTAPLRTSTGAHLRLTDQLDPLHARGLIVLSLQDAFDPAGRAMAVELAGEELLLGYQAIRAVVVVPGGPAGARALRSQLDLPFPVLADPSADAGAHAARAGLRLFDRDGAELLAAELDGSVPPVADMVAVLRAARSRGRIVGGSPTA